MVGSRKLRRHASLVAVVGVALGAIACEPPPEPSDQIGVTYPVFADGAAIQRPRQMNERGEITTCAGAECYVWRDGDISVIAHDDARVLSSDMSNRGHVVGRVVEGGVASPFVWRDGELATLPTGDAPDGYASYVNDHGVVAGAVRHDSEDPPGIPDAAVWRDGQLVTVPENDWASSSAVGINDRGQVALHATVADDPEDPLSRSIQGAIWDVKSNELIELGTLGGARSEAYDINGRGMVIGTSETADGETHAFLWRDGQMIDLGTLGGDWSRPNDLNEWGQVVGISRDADGEMRGFLWHEGEMIDLGVDIRTSGGGPKAINNWGQIVGSLGISSFDSEDGTRDHTEAFLWQNDRMTDLGDLLPSDWPDDYFWATSALDINDRGQILGQSETLRLGAGFIYPAARWEVSPTWGYYPDGLP